MNKRPRIEFLPVTYNMLKEFVSENVEAITQKPESHIFDREAAKQWAERQELRCTQDIAKLIIKYTKSVSYDEWYGELKKSFEDILRHLTTTSVDIIIFI